MWRNVMETDFKKSGGLYERYQSRELIKSYPSIRSVKDFLFGESKKYSSVNLDEPTESDLVNFFLETNKNGKSIDEIKLIVKNFGRKSASPQIYGEVFHSADSP